MKQKRAWQAISFAGVIGALLLINDAISRGMNSALAGRDVNVVGYILELIGAVVLVGVVIFAGIRLKR